MSEHPTHTEKTVMSNQQKYFVGIYATKYFAILIKFWWLNQNILLGQQQNFCCIHFFLSAMVVLCV